MCDLLVDTRYLMVKVKSVHYTFISVSQHIYQNSITRIQHTWWNLLLQKLLVGGLLKDIVTTIVLMENF